MSQTNTELRISRTKYYFSLITLLLISIPKTFRLVVQIIKLNQICLFCLNGTLLDAIANTRFSAVHIRCIHLLMSAVR
jgi:hypothetical protein